MTIIEKITQLFERQPEWTVKDIVQEIDSSKQMVHIALNRLLDQGYLEKLGRTPKTFYRKKATGVKSISYPELNSKQSEWLNEQFLLITETGSMLSGIEGFAVWCRQRKLPVDKTFKEFVTTKKNMKHIMMKTV